MVAAVGLALPGHDRILRQRAGRVQVAGRVVEDHVAEPLARGAGALGSVEGEQALRHRRALLAAPAAARTRRERRLHPIPRRLDSDVGRPGDPGGVGGGHHQPALGPLLLPGGAHRLQQAVGLVRHDPDPVHHHPRLDGALRQLLETEHPAALEHARVAHPGDGPPQRLRPRAGAAVGEEHRHLPARQPVEAPRHHLRGGIDRQLDAALRAVRRAGPDEEQPEVVGDLREGSDGGAGILDRLALPHGHGRQQAPGGIHRRLRPLVHELAEVGRKGLQETALALGEERVEGEARLARAADAGDGRNPVVREIDVHPPEVVSGHAAQPDGAGI